MNSGRPGHRFSGRSKPRVLTFVHYYLPGYKAGGPVRSIANLVSRLGDEFEFWIVTSDRDAHDEEPYSDVRIDEWNAVGKAHVFYASLPNQRLGATLRLIRATEHEVLYLNSFFSFASTIRPLVVRRLGLAPRRPLIVAPRGEFSQGALGLKLLKKRVYMAAARVLGLYRGVIWQASSEHEAEEIRSALGRVAEQVVIAPDLPSLPEPVLTPPPQESGHPLRLVFLSRVSPMKNLDYALRVLARVQIPVEFTVFGPVSDAVYWDECRGLFTDLPSHVSVRYGGLVPHDLVAPTLANHDLFFLPTRGENYGHVIHEALAAGLPALISDRTPWRDLDSRGVGWDLPLADDSLYVAAIEECAAWESSERERRRLRCIAYAREAAESDEDSQANRQMFLSALTAIEGPSRAYPSGDSERPPQ